MYVNIYFDVSSLYTNIPHDVSACCEALAESGHTSPPIDDLKALMYDVLTKNNFTFMDDHYLQIFGTSMRTRMAPSYACLFMSRTLTSKHGWRAAPKNWGKAAAILVQSKSRRNCTTFNEGPMGHSRIWSK